MKKIIALVLSFALIFSSLSVFSFAAENQGNETTTKQSLLDQIFDQEELTKAMGNFKGVEFPTEINGISLADADMEELLNNGVLDDVKVMGYSYKNLYTGTTPMVWGGLGISKEDFTIIEGLIDIYFRKVMIKKFGEPGNNLIYSSENALSIINFISRIINPNHTEITEINNHAVSTRDDFFKTIGEVSGLEALIQANWCNKQNFTYKPVLAILGFDFGDVDILGNAGKYNDASKVTPILIRTVLNTVLREGPLDYILRIIANFEVGFSTAYPALRELFRPWVDVGAITLDELKTMKGLMNLVVNHNNLNDSENIHFIKTPDYRFASCTTPVSSDNETPEADTATMFFYMLMYLNLVGRHTYTAPDGTKISNADIVEKYISKVEANSDKLSKIDGKLPKVLIAFLRLMFQGNPEPLGIYLPGILADRLEDIKTELKPTNILKGWIMAIFNNIADIFRRIFNSFKNFGKF